MYRGLCKVYCPSDGHAKVELQYRQKVFVIWIEQEKVTQHLSFSLSLSDASPIEISLPATQQEQDMSRNPSKMRESLVVTRFTEPSS